jgi:predicted nucleotide-binding protein (sugar kinase/HSP70/actin superfamily)
MKGLEDIINEINDAEKIAKKEVKFIYNFFLAFIVNQDDKNFLELSDSQAIQLINWLRDFVLPLYEDKEEFEQCKKVKSVIDRISYLKKISK